jgi:DNA polymerase-3 subunit epsilon
VKILWFDIETTGLDPKRHAIIELAYKVDLDGQVVAEGTLTANADGREIDDTALKVNGRTREWIAAQPSQRELYTRLLAVLDKHVDRYKPGDKFHPGGYNLKFDVEFLWELWKAQEDKYLGSYFFFGRLDPAELIGWLKWTGKLPGFPPKATLVDVARYLGLDVAGAHGGLVDVNLAREVALRMRAVLQGLNVKPRRQCPDCKGRAAGPDAPECPRCDGTGWIEE